VRARTLGTRFPRGLTPYIVGLRFVLHPAADRLEKLEGLVEDISRLVGHTRIIYLVSAGYRTVLGRLPAGIDQKV